MKKIIIFLSIFLVSGILISASGQPRVPYSARMNSGRIYYRDNRYEKAVEQFKFAIEENPQSADARAWLGAALSHLRIFLEAAAQFDTAFQLDSSYITKVRQNDDFRFQAWIAFFDATRENIHTNNLEDAINYINNGLKIEPENRQGLTILAQLYVQLNRLDELKQKAQDMMKEDPENSMVYTMLGLYFFNQSEWDSAHRYYEQAAMRYQTNERKSRDALARELAITDTVRLNQIVGRLRVVRQDRNPDRLRSYIEDSLRAGRKLRLIARIADDIYMTQGELNANFFRAGIASLQKGSADTVQSEQSRYFKQAISEFERALNYNPLDLDAKHNLAFTFYRLRESGSDVRAMTLFEEIINASILAITELSNELCDSILTFLAGDTTSKGLIPISPELTFKIENELARQEHKLSGYQWLYLPEVKRIKGSVEPVAKGDVFLTLYDVQGLENLYLLFGAAQTNVATELKGENRTEEANKKYDEAISSFNRVLVLNPKSSDAYKNLAVCYREKGDSKKAFELMKKWKDLIKGEK